MIEYDLDTQCSILHVQPKSAIEQDDFVKLAKAATRTSRQPAASVLRNSGLPVRARRDPHRIV